MREKRVFGRGAMHLSRLVVALAVVALVAAGCGGDGDGGGDADKKGASGERQSGGELTFALPSEESGDFQYLLPEAGGCRTFCNSILTAIFDPLVFQDPKTNEIVGGLAKSWDVSEDGLTWTIVLRDATFHDGTPVTAEDVQFSLDLPLDKALPVVNAGYPASLRANVKSVDVVDEKTVQINMTRPQANFVPSVLGRSYYGIIPKHVYEKMGYEAFGAAPVGSGPYKFVKWVPGQEITLERNPDYTWGPSFTETAGKAPSLDKLTFKYIGEPSTRLAAFEAGEVDAFDGIPVNDQARLESDSDVTVVKVAKNGSPGNIEFNTAQGLGADPVIRKAVALAIDQKAFNQATYAGVATPICTLLEKRMKFVDPDACVKTGDPEAAKAMLDEAGWVEGSGGVREKDGQKLQLVGLVGATYAKELEYLQANLAAVGIKLIVKPGSDSAVTDAILKTTGWDILRSTPAGWTNEDPNILRAQFHSSLHPPEGTSNRSYYENPEVDKLLDEGLAELDEGKREALYFEAQKLVVADVPVVPLLSIPQNIATKANVHGIIPDARGTYRYFQDAWIGD